MEDKIEGNVYKFGDDINTDYIIPGKYLMNVIDPNELATHVMEGVNPNFYEEIEEGDIIAAGENFGCGSSREEAPTVIRDAGISVVLAKSFARIFYRNAINIGLPLMECSTDNLNGGDRIKVNLDAGVISFKNRNDTFEAKPLPKAMQKILNDGGLVAHFNKNDGFGLK